MPTEARSLREAAFELHRLLNGFQVTQAIHVAAAMRVADQIGLDPVPVTDIAAAVASHPGALYRLLRALAAVGIFREHDDRRFSHTAMSECLRSDCEYPVGPHAVFVGQKNQWDAWGHLLHSVRTGENAFRAVHGMSAWDYRASNPEQNRIFNAAMTGNSRRVEQAIVAAYDFSRFSRLADIGGGQGSMLAALLQAYPQLRGILFDLPYVVTGAGPVLEAAGVAARCETVAGDMLVCVPEGCDGYLLKYIIHDWDDAHCRRILRACRAAMAADAELIVVDRLVGPPNEDAAVKLADLHMLVGPGGGERTRAEFAALLQAEALAIVEVRRTDSPVSLIVARPA